MRIINLDETGIKIITSNKKQMYLTTDEIKDFINKKFTLKENKLTFGNKHLLLSRDDLEQFSDVYNYIKVNFEEKV